MELMIMKKLLSVALLILLSFSTTYSMDEIDWQRAYKNSNNDAFDTQPVFLQLRNRTGDNVFVSASPHTEVINQVATHFILIQQYSEINEINTPNLENVGNKISMWWQQQPPDNAISWNPHPTDIIEDAEGNIIICGWDKRVYNPSPNLVERTSGFILKLDPNFNILYYVLTTPETTIESGLNGIIELNEQYYMCGWFLPDDGLGYKRPYLCKLENDGTNLVHHVSQNNSRFHEGEFTDLVYDDFVIYAIGSGTDHEITPLGHSMWNSLYTYVTGENFPTFASGMFYYPLNDANYKTKSIETLNNYLYFSLNHNSNVGIGKIQENMLYYDPWEIHEYSITSGGTNQSLYGYDLCAASNGNLYMCGDFSNYIIYDRLYQGFILETDADLNLLDYRELELGVYNKLTDIEEIEIQDQPSIMSMGDLWYMQTIGNQIAIRRQLTLVKEYEHDVIHCSAERPISEDNYNLNHQVFDYFSTFSGNKMEIIISKAPVVLEMLDKCPSCCEQIDFQSVNITENDDGVCYEFEVTILAECDVFYDGATIQYENEPEVNIYSSLTPGTPSIVYNRCIAKTIIEIPHTITLRFYSGGEIVCTKTMIIYSKPFDRIASPFREENISGNVIDAIQSSYIQPNPVNEKMTFVFDLKEKANVGCELYNMHGEKVYEYETAEYGSGENSKEINTSNLVDGAYILQINVNGEVLAKRFIVVH